MRRIFLGLGALALGFVTAIGGAPAQPAQPAKVGTLVCDVSGGIGMIIASHKQIQCAFNSDVPGQREIYVGIDQQVRARHWRHERRPNGLGGLCADVARIRRACRRL